MTGRHGPRYLELVRNSGGATGADFFGGGGGKIILNVFENIVRKICQNLK